MKALVFLMLFIAGCASMAERGLLPDVKDRQLPEVSLGPEIILLKQAKLGWSSRFASLIETDGRAHLFLTDKEKKVHHIEILGNEVMAREILGTMEGDDFHQALEAIEHPQGRIRVLAGDKMFIRSENSEWLEIKGNRCERFIEVGDDLLCAFIAKGEEVEAPRRTDWTVGWFILIPVVFWSDVQAEKLVVAKESKDGWSIIGVLDPETKLSAGSDFKVETDRRGLLHFLYRASGGSSAFAVLFTPAGGGAWGEDISETVIRYARVRYDRLLEVTPNMVNDGSAPSKTSMPWLPIQSLPMAPMPFFVGKGEQAISYRFIGPIKRDFVINGTSGDLDGLIWVNLYKLELTDGTRKIASSDVPWIQVRIREGQWVPRFDIVAATDLPDSDWVWLNDPGALIKSDLKGVDHILLVGEKGPWTARKSEMCYLVKTGADWSAPIILGHDPTWHAPRTLAVDKSGKVLAVWEDKSKNVVGRWILPQGRN